MGLCCWSDLTHLPSRAQPCQEVGDGNGDRPCVERQRKGVLRDRNEDLLPIPDLGQELHGIEVGTQNFDPAAHLSGRTGIGQKPIAGCRWRMVALAHRRAVPLLFGELERRLEGAHKQPRPRIEGSKLMAANVDPKPFRRVKSVYAIIASVQPVCLRALDRQQYFSICPKSDTQNTILSAIHDHTNAVYSCTSILSTVSMHLGAPVTDKLIASQTKASI